MSFFNRASSSCRWCPLAQAGAKPNVPTFTALLTACFKCETPARSREVLQLMASYGLDAQELPQQLLRQAAPF
jgi:hypothetical protein